MQLDRNCIASLQRCRNYLSGVASMFFHVPMWLTIIYDILSVSENRDYYIDYKSSITYYTYLRLVF
jgi:hypothetical protein